MPTALCLGKPECDKCDLCNQGKDEKGVGRPRHVGIPLRSVGTSRGDYNKYPGILYIGRNPGFNEDEKNEVFVGKSGRMLIDVYIRGAQLDKISSIYLANAVRCYTINNAVPRAPAFRACLPYTLQDLRHTLFRHKENHLAVVLLGGDTTVAFYRYILGIKGMSLKKGMDQNGTQHEISWMDGKHEVTGRFFVFSFYHPAAVVRDRNLINSVHLHNDLLLACMESRMAVPSEPKVEEPRVPKKKAQEDLHDAAVKRLRELRQRQERAVGYYDKP